MNISTSSLAFGEKKIKRTRDRKMVIVAEVLGMGIMVLGVILLFQPFSIQFFKWGFPFLLIGYTVYNVFAHIPR